MYPRQSGHYPFASQQPSQYSSQPTQYYESTPNYYQGPPQQQPSQYTISQSSVVPQFHVFTQPVAVAYTQYPYQQQHPPQPQAQQVPDQIYYNRQAAPATIVTTTPQPAQPKQISQPEQMVTQYHMIPSQQTQVSQISTNPTQQLIQQQGYVPQPLKKKDKSSYPQSSMMLNQIQSPSVYQQPGQIQVPMRQVPNLQQQQMSIKQQQYQQVNQTQSSEGQFSSSCKQQFHFNQNEPPGCFDIIGRGSLPSVVFESDVQLL